MEKDIKTDAWFYYLIIAVVVIIILYKLGAYFLDCNRESFDDEEDCGCGTIYNSYIIPIPRYCKTLSKAVTKAVHKHAATRADADQVRLNAGCPLNKFNYY